MGKKVVLAFSGGLDTSFCAVYLKKDKGLEVCSAIVNTGGFSAQELEEIAGKASALGLENHTALDVTREYYQKCIRYLVFGNILKNSTYPLSVSSERIFQAIAIANYAKEIGASYIAHGSTGAGNDQVRFDLAFQILCPEIEVITPIRDLKLSRQAEIDYLRANGIESDWKKAEYSINKGLWGTSIGGRETLSSHTTIPAEAYPSQIRREEPATLAIEFEKGEIKGVDDQRFSHSIEAIRYIESLASAYAIGRDMHVGDTIIGIKGRVAFEAAAPLIIIKAHHYLEKHTLTKWQLYWKEQLANWYGMLLHEAQYFDPVMRNIEKFLEDSQLHVSGKVFISLAPYRFEITGIESPFDMMQADYARYGEENTAYTGEDVKGFIKILGTQMKLYLSTESKEAHGN